MKALHTIGIDLATTHHVVTIPFFQSPSTTYPDGRVTVEVVKDDFIPESSTIAATIAWSEEGQLMVGNEARAKGVAGRMIEDVKRIMGMRFEQALEEWKGAPLQKDVAGRAVFKIEGSALSAPIELTPQEVSALHLLNLRRLVEAKLGFRVRKAVITVPAQFNVNQVMATKDAARIAGFIQTKMVVEPTAAAVYASKRVREQGLNTLPRKLFHVVVYDFGGGTFDVNVLQVHPTRGWRTLATCGNNRLGGVDVTQAIVNNFQQQISGIMHERRLKTEKEWDETTKKLLRDTAEMVKKELSKKEEFKTTIALPDPIGEVEVALSRQRMESLIRHLIRKTMQCMDKALSEASRGETEQMRIKDKQRIEKGMHIIVTGGSSRMPIVAASIRKVFRVGVRVDDEVDELVGRGAGLIAAHSEGVLRRLHLTDVLPSALGTRVMDTNCQSGYRNSIVVPKNATYGCDMTSTPRPIKMTRERIGGLINVVVLQGEEGDAAKCTEIGSFRVPLSNFTVQEAKVHVQYQLSVDVEGILTVGAIDALTGEVVHKALMNTSELMLDEATICAMKAKLERLFPLPDYPLPPDDVGAVFEMADEGDSDESSDNDDEEEQSDSDSNEGVNRQLGRTFQSDDDFYSSPDEDAREYHGDKPRQPDNSPTSKQLARSRMAGARPMHVNEAGYAQPTGSGTARKAITNRRRPLGIGAPSGPQVKRVVVEDSDEEAASRLRIRGSPEIREENQRRGPRAQPPSADEMIAMQQNSGASQRGGSVQQGQDTQRGGGARRRGGAQGEEGEAASDSADEGSGCP